MHIFIATTYNNSGKLTIWEHAFAICLLAAQKAGEERTNICCINYNLLDFVISLTRERYKSILHRL